MKKEDCFYLGKISKPFSYKGELILFLDVDDLSRYEKLNFVYLDIAGRLVRYDIINSRFHGNKLVVALQDVTSEEANLLVGKDMYLPLDMLPKLEGNNFYFHEVIGFEVFDNKKGNIGKIKEIIENTTHPIMSIDYKGKEILVPIVDEFVKKVDRDKKILNIEAPQGLIDIYLNE